MSAFTEIIGGAANLVTGGWIGLAGAIVPKLLNYFEVRRDQAFSKEMAKLGHEWNAFGKSYDVAAAEAAAPAAPWANTVAKTTRHILCYASLIAMTITGLIVAFKDSPTQNLMLVFAIEAELTGMAWGWFYGSRGVEKLSALAGQIGRK